MYLELDVLWVGRGFKCIHCGRKMLLLMPNVLPHFIRNIKHHKNKHKMFSRRLAMQGEFKIILMEQCWSGKTFVSWRCLCGQSWKWKCVLNKRSRDPLKIMQACAPKLLHPWSVQWCFWEINKDCQPLSLRNCSIKRSQKNAIIIKNYSQALKTNLNVFAVNY